VPPDFTHDEVPGDHLFLFCTGPTTLVLSAASQLHSGEPITIPLSQAHGKLKESPVHVAVDLVHMFFSGKIFWPVKDILATIALRPFQFHEIKLQFNSFRPRPSYLLTNSILVPGSK
jgi:hypothetical protein